MAAKPRILFVDDEPSVLNGLRRSFLDKESTWEMTFLSKPEEAIAACRTNRFDVVVSDMKMPGMSGIELIIALRKIMTDGIYIILTGAVDLRGAIDSINRAGIFRFFTKPCPSFLLKEGISAALFARRPSSTAAPADTKFSTVGEEALNQLSVAVVVVNPSGRVRFMNRRGGELCAEGDGLSIGPSDICRASTQGESAHLLNVIHESASVGTRKALSITRPSMKRSLFVVVAPLPLFKDGPNTEASVALYISDPAHNSVPPPEQLAALLDLPPAKAKLAHILAQGESLDEAAAKMNVKLETVRTYLKDIFSKTGTTRQAELVKLILSHPSVDI